MGIFDFLAKKRGAGAEAPPSDPGPAKKINQSADPRSEAAIHGLQRSTRAALNGPIMDEKLAIRRTHRDTQQRWQAKTVTDGILDQDRKFKEVPDVVKDHFKEIMFDLTTAARRAPDTFYQKFSGKKAKLAGNKTVHDLVMIALSVWLMGEEFEYNKEKKLAKTPGKKLQIWKVIGCNHRDLIQYEKPRLRAQIDLDHTDDVELIDVLYGLQKL